MSDPAPRPAYDPPPGLVAVGSRVEVELISRDGERERLAFDIVPEQAADFEAGFLAVTAPLARAIVGSPAGAEVAYRMGDIVRVRVLSVERSQRRAEGDAAAAREATTREAVERAKADETIQLALTFSSKWGDYDPSHLDRDTSGDDSAAPVESDRHPEPSSGSERSETESKDAGRSQQETRRRTEEPE